MNTNAGAAKPGGSKLRSDQLGVGKWDGVRWVVSSLKRTIVQNTNNGNNPQNIKKNIQLWNSFGVLTQVLLQQEQRNIVRPFRKNDGRNVLKTD